MRISFFSTPSPKKYNYRPRYWDERKEEIENIRRRYSTDDDQMKAEMVKERISGHWKKRIDKRTRKKTSALTLLIYLLIIALLAWFIFF